MPSVSKKQQSIMSIALAIKRGKKLKFKPSKEARRLAREMTEKQLRDFAKTKRKGLPSRKKKK